MTISRLAIENYKAFAKEAVFAVQPITLLFGYNSAGKSAALRFLKLLADSTTGESTFPLNLGSAAARGSDFKGLLSKYTSSPRINFQLDFDNFSVKFSILNIPERRTHIIQQLEVELMDGKGRLVLDWNPYSLDFDMAANSYVAIIDEGIMTDEQVSFEGLVPEKYAQNMAPYLGPLAEGLKNYSRNFYSLAPDCVVPGRYHTETTPIKKVSPRGEGLISLLQVASEEVLQDISNWYQNATGYSFKRTEITIGDRSGHRFTLHPNADPNIDIDVIDTGEGMGQVLPVVSLLTLAQHEALGREPMISLEHPELHIHPDAHSHLADLLCQVVTSNPSCKILVETHSENLLLGLQLAIAEGRIKPKDVAVHWVRGTDKGAEVELVEFDKDARPSRNNWPVDVYRKNSKLARDLFEKRKSHKN